MPEYSSTRLARCRALALPRFSVTVIVVGRPVTLAAYQISPSACNPVSLLATALAQLLGGLLLSVIETILGLPAALLSTSTADITRKLPLIGAVMLCA